MFKIIDPRYSEEALGFIPEFLSEDDPRSAAEQFNENYAHGGGWRPMKGWKMGPVGEIRWGQEETLHPFAVAQLRDETIRVHTFGWVSIMQADGSFEVSRMG